MIRAAAAGVLALIACSAPIATPPPKPQLPPQPQPRLAVLGLEPDDPADAPLARELTTALRSVAAAADIDRDLADMKQLGTCANEAAACIAAIGADLRVDYLVYGHVANGHLALALMDVAAHINRRVARAPILADHAATATAAYNQLVGAISR